MAPTNRPDKNTSGEFVTYAHFDAFMEEFRIVSGGIGTKLDGMSDKLTQMQIKLSGVDKDVSAIQTQTTENSKHSDATSDRVRVLEEDRTVRGALQAQATALSQPVRTIKDKMVETVTTAVVLGVLAVAYNLVRDGMVRDSSGVKQPTHATPPVP